MHRVYTKIIEIMPFFQAADVVTEMINRFVHLIQFFFNFSELWGCSISDRPNKSHISETLPVISEFCKAHRKKVVKARNERKKPGINNASDASTSQTRTATTEAEPVSASASNSHPTSTPPSNPHSASTSNSNPHSASTSNSNHHHTHAYPPGTVFHIFGGGQMHTVGPIGPGPNNAGPNSTAAHNVNPAPGGGGGIHTHISDMSQLPDCNHQ
jgi:hypothetical protein